MFLVVSGGVGGWVKGRGRLVDVVVNWWVDLELLCKWGWFSVVW